MKKVYGTGDGSSLIFYLNGFSHDKIESLNLASFLVGVSDAESVFDMKYSSTMVKTGQVTCLHQGPYLYRNLECYRKIVFKALLSLADRFSNRP